MGCLNEVTVGIDFGHGEINPDTLKYVTKGKKSPIWPDGSRYYEGVGNKKIGIYVIKGLEKLGINYELTRPIDDWRDTPLKKRKSKINKASKKNKKMFSISIHSNGSSKQQAHGAEVWTWPGQSPSDPMATIWMEEHIKMFPELTIRKDTSDGDLDKESKFTMNSVDCPSFLIETMFHTNRKECKILASKEGKKKIAQGIINAIVRIIKELY